VSASSTPGHLQATATSFSGAGCGTTSNGSAPVEFGPASPLSPPSFSFSNNTGGSTSFSFTALNASQCTGTITPSTGTSFTSTFCNSAASCTGAQTVTASFPANSSNADIPYTVKVSCTGPGSATAVQSPTSPVVTVPHTIVVDTACSAPPTVPGAGGTSYTRTTTSVTANYSKFGNKAIDPTSFQSIFTSPGKPDIPWPSEYDAVPTFTLNTHNYVSAAFTSTAPYIATTPTMQGQYFINESGFTAAISMTISTKCGDFGQLSPTSVVAGCKLNAGIAGSRLIWSGSGGTTGKLSDGVPYYLNVINANIGALTPGGSGVATSTAVSNCTGGACTIPLQNGPGSWPH